MDFEFAERCDECATNRGAYSAIREVIGWNGRSWHFLLTEHVDWFLAIGGKRLDVACVPKKNSRSANVGKVRNAGTPRCENTIYFFWNHPGLRRR